MFDASTIWMIAPGIGLVAGLLVGATGVGGAALATPLLILLGVPAPIAVATDAVFCAVIKAVGIGAHKDKLVGALGKIRGMILASMGGALLGVFALQALAQTAGGEALVRRALGLSLVMAGLITVHRVTSGRREVEGRAVLPTPIRWLAAAVLGFAVGLTSIGAGSLLLPLLFVSVTAPFATLVALSIAQGLVLAVTAGAAHLGAGLVEPTLLFSLVLGGVPGVVVGARLHGVFDPKTLASTTATLIAVVGLKLVI